MKNLLSRSRVGIGISAQAVNFVVVNAETIVSHATFSWTDEDPMSFEKAVRSAMSAIRGHVGWRPRIRIALGPTMAQSKLLQGLPSMEDEAGIRALVRENVDRFFRTAAEHAIIVGAESMDGNRALAVVYPTAVVTTIARVAIEVGLALESVRPTIALLGAALKLTNEDETVVWHDGPLAARAVFSGGDLISTAHGRAASETLMTTTPLVSGLNALGEVAWSFADAYSAAMSDKHMRLALQTQLRELVPGNERQRQALAISATIAAALILALAPGIAPMWVEHHATAKLRPDSVARARAHDQRELLSRMTTEIETMYNFEEAHLAPLELLHAITAALPATDALLSLKIDSTGTGSLVASTVNAAKMVSALSGTSGLRTVEMAGPVSRETIGGRERERANVRFRAGHPSPDRSR